MSLQKGKTTVSTSVQLQGHSQSRNPQSRGTTPPVYRGQEEQNNQQQQQQQQQYTAPTIYPGPGAAPLPNIYNNQPFQVPQLHQQQQQQQTVTPHEIDKQLPGQPGLAGPHPQIASQQNMYQNPATSMRGPPTFFPNQSQNMRPQQQQQRYPAMNQPPAQPYPSSMVYMQPSNATQFSGTQIIVQPNMSNMQQMLVPGPTGAGIQQTPYMTPTQPMAYTLASSQATGPYNPLTRYNTTTQNQQQRPTSNSSTPQSQQPPERKRHILQIVDPNTGKDISSEILKTPVVSSRSTPPGSAAGSNSGSNSQPGSGSRSTPVGVIEPNTTPPPASVSSTNQQNPNICAQFAAQVAATLKEPAAGDNSNAVPIDVTQQPPSIMANQEVPGNVQYVPTYSPAQPEAVEGDVPTPPEELAENNEYKSPADNSVTSTSQQEAQPTAAVAPAAAAAEISVTPVELSNSAHSDSSLEPAQSLSSQTEVSEELSKQLETNAPVSDSDSGVHSVSTEQSDSSVIGSSESSSLVSPQISSITAQASETVPSQTVVATEQEVSPTPAPSDSIDGVEASQSVEVKQMSDSSVRTRQQSPVESSSSSNDISSQDVNRKSEEKESAVESSEKVTKSESKEAETKPVVNSEEVMPSTEQPATTVKKDKGKKKIKELNKKGEEMQGSDMDVFREPKPVSQKTKVTEEPSVVESSKQEPEVTPPAETSKPVVNQVPTVQINIEDKVQEENVKNKEKSQPKESTEEKPAQKAVPQLKYNYKADQWSPLNIEGKKLYDREFLLQMQFATDSTTKPVGLPDLPEIILDKPHDKAPGGMGQSFQRGGGSRDRDGGQGPMGREFGGFDFTPGYVRSPRGNDQQRGGSGGGRMTKSGSSQRSKMGGPPQRIITHVSMGQEVQLHKAESAWKPTPVASKGSSADAKEDPEEAKTEGLYKKTRSILNKLTPQKFQTLVKQMADMDIDTEDRLKGVTDLIFEKAVSEPGFSVAYASMCRYLTMIKVKSTKKQGEFVNFRAILLTRCQKEFERDKESELDLEERRKKLKEADTEKKTELKAELELAETMARKRSLGNIRFIGELFKLKMLTENIMHDCVFKLLKAKDVDSLECLCRLLTTIGKELDSEKAKPRMDQYFNQMQKIIQDKKTSSRVRFMLQDVAELRLNKWVPRRDDNNPKTLDQIHKDAKREEEERNLAIQQAALQQQSSSRDSRGGGGGRRGPGPQGGGPMGGSDGWNTVGGRQPTSMRLTTSDRQAIDPSRLKLSRQNVDESIQLGPGGGVGRFTGWQRGSTGGGSRNSQEGERPNAPSNRFSALNRAEEDNRSRFGASPNRRGGSGGFGRPSRVTPRSSQEQDREKAQAVAAARNLMSGQTTPKEGPSRESSRGRPELRDERKEMERPAPVQASVAAGKQLTDEEMDKKTIAILDEYLHIQDLKEAILCVEEIKSSTNLHLFVSSALNHVLERSKAARMQTGNLLHDVVKQGLISVDAYVNGLLEVLQVAEDMEIDVPMIWLYLGELVSPMIQDGSVPLVFLKKAVEPLSANNKAGVLVAAILHDASNREGHKKVGGLWRDSGLQWSDFVPTEEINQFLKANKLEFTTSDGSQPSTPTTSMPPNKVEEHLNNLLSEKVSNEQIFDWIETNLDDKTTKSNKFVRVLMTSVCSCAITGQGSSAKIEQTKVTNRGALLQKYLDHQAEFELQALYALQALVHKLEHPPGVLRTLFDTLYDEDIISEDAFNQWEKSTDPDEQEGKGVAMRQVVSFFTWLREADDEGSDS